MTFDREKEKKERAPISDEELLTPIGALREKKRRGEIRTQRQQNTYKLKMKIRELSDDPRVDSIGGIRDLLATEGYGKDEYGNLLKWDTSEKQVHKMFRYEVWGKKKANEKLSEMRYRRRSHKLWKQYYDNTHSGEVKDVFADDYVTSADSFQLDRDVLTGKIKITPISADSWDKLAKHQNYVKRRKRLVMYTKRGEFGVKPSGEVDHSGEYILRKQIRKVIDTIYQDEENRELEKRVKQCMRDTGESADISEKTRTSMRRRIKRKEKKKLKAELKPKRDLVPGMVDDLVAQVKTEDQRTTFLHKDKGNPVEWNYCPAYASKDKAKRGEQRMRAEKGHKFSRAVLNIPFLDYTPPKRVQIMGHALSKNDGGFKLVDVEAAKKLSGVVIDGDVIDDIEGVNARIRLPKTPKEALITYEAGIIVSRQFAKRGEYVFVSPIKEIIVEKKADLRKAPRITEAKGKALKKKLKKEDSKDFVVDHKKGISLHSTGAQRKAIIEALGDYKDAYVDRGDCLVRFMYPGFGRMLYSADHGGTIVYVGSPEKDDGTQYYRSLDTEEEYIGCIRPPSEGSKKEKVDIRVLKKGKRADVMDVGGTEVCGNEVEVVDMTDGSIKHICPTHGEVKTTDTADIHKPERHLFYKQKYQIVRKAPLKVGDKLHSRTGVKGVITAIEDDVGKDKQGRPYDMVVHPADVWVESEDPVTDRLLKRKGKKKGGLVLERKVSDGTVFVFLDGEFSTDTPFTPRSGLSVSPTLIGSMFEDPNFDPEEFHKKYQQYSVLSDVLKAFHLKAVHDKKAGTIKIMVDEKNPKPEPGLSAKDDPHIIKKRHIVNGIKYDYMYIPTWLSRKYFGQGSIRENTADFDKKFKSQILTRFSLLPVYPHALNLRAVAWSPPSVVDDRRVIMDVSDAVRLGYEPGSHIPFRITFRKEPVSLGKSVQTYEVVVDGTGRWKNCIGIHPYLARQGVVDFDGDQVVAYTPTMDSKIHDVKLSSKMKTEIRGYKQPFTWEDLEKKVEDAHVPIDEHADQCARYNAKQYKDDGEIQRLGGLRKRYVLAYTGENPVLNVMGEEITFTPAYVNKLCNVENIMKKMLPLSDAKEYAKRVVDPKRRHSPAKQKVEYEKILKELKGIYAGEELQNMKDLVKDEVTRKILDSYTRQKDVRNPYRTLFDDYDPSNENQWEGYLQFTKERKYHFVLEPNKRIIDKLVWMQLKDSDIVEEV